MSRFFQFLHQKVFGVKMQTYYLNFQAKNDFCNVVYNVKNGIFEIWRHFVFVLICQNSLKSTADFNQKHPRSVKKTSHFT